MFKHYSKRAKFHHKAGKTLDKKGELQTRTKTDKEKQDEEERENKIEKSRKSRAVKSDSSVDFTGGILKRREDESVCSSDGSDDGENVDGKPKPKKRAGKTASAKATAGKTASPKAAAGKTASPTAKAGKTTTGATKKRVFGTIADKDGKPLPNWQLAQMKRRKIQAANTHHQSVQDTVESFGKAPNEVKLAALEKLKDVGATVTTKDDRFKQLFADADGSLDAEGQDIAARMEFDDSHISALHKAVESWKAKEDSEDINEQIAYDADTFWQRYPGMEFGNGGDSSSINGQEGQPYFGK